MCGVLPSFFPPPFFFVMSFSCREAAAEKTEAPTAEGRDEVRPANRELDGFVLREKTTDLLDAIKKTRVVFKWVFPKIVVFPPNHPF